MEVVMIEKLEVPLVGEALCIIFVLFTIILIVVALYLQFKLWTANPVLLKEYRQLKLLVDSANNGHEGSQLQCEHDCRVKKGMYFCEETKLPKSSYSVHRYLLWQIWGHY